MVTFRNGDSNRLLEKKNNRRFLSGREKTIVDFFWEWGKQSSIAFENGESNCRLLLVMEAVIVDCFWKWKKQSSFAFGNGASNR